MKFGFTVVEKNINQNLLICSEVLAINFSSYLNKCAKYTNKSMSLKVHPYIKYNNYSANILSYITNVKPMIACLVFKHTER